MNPLSFILSACFDQSSDQPRVNRGNRKEGGKKKIKEIGEFHFRGILQPMTGGGDDGGGGV